MHCDLLRSMCDSLSITSQLVLFLWQTIKIDPLGHVRVVEALQNFVQKCDPKAKQQNLWLTEPKGATPVN